MRNKTILDLFKELEETQMHLLLRLGRRIIPSLTPEDALQPNDYPELEHHPEFRYEEGILAGIRSCKAAYLSNVASSRE